MKRSIAVCPMHEEPLHLIPQEHRAEVTAALERRPRSARLPGHDRRRPLPVLPPDVQRADGAVRRRLVAASCEDVRVRRMILSEQDRIGIGTFQPKDEKNQDATELTGDINYRKIAEYGTESDPRAFNFDGEFNIANRGIIEFIEVLKLDVAFLYDLLGASQEHKIKPKKFAQTDIDEVIIGHTNEPEYKKLQSNEFMEALRDRTVKIDVPYVTRLADEIKIYEKDYNSRKVRGKRLAPHTLEVAAMWAVLTRLEEPKNAGLDPDAEAQALQRQDACPASPRTTSRSCARRPSARGCTASARATSRTRSPTPWSLIPTSDRSTRSWS